MRRGAFFHAGIVFRTTGLRTPVVRHAPSRYFTA